MFILLMFFLFKYIDDLVGKGLAWYSIVELMFYSSATNVAMALPLAVLLSSIMTFGNLGEQYELVAIKSVGVSLRKAMAPLFVAVCMLTVTSFWFNDFILPIANRKFFSLLNDVTQQKPTFLIKEGVFNTSIRGYAIKVGEKDPDNETIRDIIIYDESNSYARVPTVIKAREGKMYKAEDGETLVLKLYNGVRYEEKASESGSYNPRQQFYRIRFKETEQKFDLSSFKMTRTDENEFNKFSQMMDLKKLNKNSNIRLKKIDSVEQKQVKEIDSYYNNQYYFTTKDTLKLLKIKLSKPFLESIPFIKRTQTLQNSIYKAQSIKEVAQRKSADIQMLNGELRQFKIDFWKKFSIAMSCLLLFFIGAPLGAIIRKGGLGLPIVVSVVFFLIFHVITTISEKLAKEGDVSPFIGIWMPILIFSPLGAFLTYKSSVDSAIFDIGVYKLFFQEQYKKIHAKFSKKEKNT